MVHVGGWDPYDLRDLAHASWVRSVLCRTFTTWHNDKAGEELVTDDLDPRVSKPAKKEAQPPPTIARVLFSFGRTVFSVFADRN